MGRPPEMKGFPEPGKKEERKGKPSRAPSLSPTIPPADSTALFAGSVFTDALKVECRGLTYVVKVWIW